MKTSHMVMAIGWLSWLFSFVSKDSNLFITGAFIYWACSTVIGHLELNDETQDSIFCQVVLLNREVTQLKEQLRLNQELKSSKKKRRIK